MNKMTPDTPSPWAGNGGRRPGAGRPPFPDDPEMKADFGRRLFLTARSEQMRATAADMSPSAEIAEMHLLALEKMTRFSDMRAYLVDHRRFPMKGAWLERAEEIEHARLAKTAPDIARKMTKTAMARCRRYYCDTYPDEFAYLFLA